MTTSRASRLPAFSLRRMLHPSPLETPSPPDPQFDAEADQRQDGNALYSSPSAFDTNVVIIMAALLCVLICALGINYVVRCALRCTRPIGFESQEEAAVRRANTGMKKKQVKSLPTVVYGKGKGLVETGSDCAICLGDFADGESLRILPKCKHGFHIKCIDTWLLSHSSCPTCRHNLMSAIAAEKRSSAEVQVVIAAGSGRASPPLWRVAHDHRSHGAAAAGSATSESNRLPDAAALAGTAMAPGLSAISGTSIACL